MVRYKAIAFLILFINSIMMIPIGINYIRGENYLMGVGAIIFGILGVIFAYILTRKAKMKNDSLD